MMECLRCARCCVDVPLTFIYTDTSVKKIEWLKYHHCETKILEKDGKKLLQVIIPLTCMHLGYDDKGYKCKIYETRPKICREFTCFEVVNASIA